MRTSCSPVRTFTRSPTIRRAARCSTTSSRTGGSCPTRCATGCTSSACRCRTSRRTPRSSTPCSGMPPSSFRRACTRASGSPSPRRCGRAGRCWRAPLGESRIRSRTVFTDCFSPTRAMLHRSPDLLERLLHDPQLREKLGRNARQRVRDEFLGVHQLIRHGRLIECVDQAYEECGRPEVFTRAR